MLMVHRNTKAVGGWITPQTGGFHWVWPVGV